MTTIFACSICKPCAGDALAICRLTTGLVRHARRREAAGAPGQVHVRSTVCGLLTCILQNSVATMAVGDRRLAPSASANRCWSIARGGPPVSAGWGSLWAHAGIRWGLAHRIGVGTMRRTSITVAPVSHAGVDCQHQAVENQVDLVST